MLPREVESQILRILDGPEDLWSGGLGRLQGAHPELADSIRERMQAMQREFETGEAAPLTLQACGDSHQADCEPDRIGPYKILNLIGEGGMGKVYLAERQQPVRQRVALKLIRLGMDSKAVVARFEQERQALALMEHDGIAKVFDGGTTERGQPYFVMELVKGVPLTTYCDQHRLSVRERLELLRKVCAAVQHAHHKGVVHRDLKPGNVLVTDGGDGTLQPKVLDFGLAKAVGGGLTAETLFTEIGQAMGTLEYMSPEQATAQDVDTRTDVYALGVMLYELLVGELPFTSEQLRQGGLLEVQRLICQVDPPKPSKRLSSAGVLSADIARARVTSIGSLQKALRSDLDWLVVKAMEKDRNRRYETVNALSADIQRNLDHEPLQAGPPSASYRLRKLARRYRGQLLAAAAVVVASLTFGSIAMLQFMRAEAKAKDAFAQKATATARAEELARVVVFQQSQLGQIDVELMGVRLRRELLDAAGQAERAQLESALVGINFTDLGLTLLGENVFARALAAIDREFAAQPLLQASLLQTLADTMVQLGLLDRAVGPQRRALALRRQQAGDDDAQTLLSIDKMAWLLQRQGELDAAEPLYQEALSSYRRLLGDEDVKTTWVLGNLGTLRLAQGDLPAAEELLQRVLAQRRRSIGEDHPDTVLSYGMLASVMLAQENLADAERYYRTQLAGCRRVHGDDAPETLTAMGNLGIVLSKMGRFTEVEPLHDEVVRRFRRLRGDEHPETLTAINNMGLLLEQQGKFEEAAALLREALAGRRRILGDDHSATLSSFTNVGLLLKDQGERDAAEPLLREAVTRGRRTLGERHVEFLAFLHNLGVLLLEQRKLQEAETVLLEAQTRRRQVIGEAAPSTLSSDLSVAQLRDAQGQHEEAETLLRALLARGADALPDDALDRMNALNSLGLVLIARGRLEEAEVYLRQALDRMQRTDTAGTDKGVVALANVALVLRRQGKLEQAAPYYRQALELSRRVLGENHARTSILLFHLGRILEQTEHPHEAVALLAPHETTMRDGEQSGDVRRLAAFLLTLGRARAHTGDPGAWPSAESNLLEAHKLLESSTISAARVDRLAIAKALAELYETWHASDPTQGHDLQAKEWQGRIAATPADTGK